MKVLEPRAYHKMPKEVLRGEKVKSYKKCLKQIEGIYKYGNESNLDPNTVVYEVYSYTEGEKEKEGNLFWGLTVMKPVYINGECNMTRGHFHEDTNCAEFYFGLQGEGLLLLMNKKGKTWAEKIYKGSIHHIDGEIAHRIVNTCDEELMVGACWPTTAGHNYKEIEDRDFGYRVFKNDSEVEFLKR